MALPISFLTADLTLERRQQRLMGMINDLDWRVKRWPKWLLKLRWNADRSMAFFPTKTIYIGEYAWGKSSNTRFVPVLGHEVAHMWRAEYSSGGRLWWGFVYVAGFIAVALALLLSAASLAWFPAGIAATVVVSSLCLTPMAWMWSMKFRLNEELAAEAVETMTRIAIRNLRVTDAAIAAFTTAQFLYGFNHPYYIFASKKEVMTSVTARVRMLEAEIAAYERGHGAHLR